MRIGLDFDNTIVSYDRVFHRVAADRDLVPRQLAVSKLAVRDHLRAAGNEDAWTELQGHVYGTRMAEAVPFPGVVECMKAWRSAGHVLFIISHKTRRPFRGPAHDLHEAATAWIDAALRDGSGPLVDPENVFFHERKEQKVSRIAALTCDVFVDDLPEVLLSPSFPRSTLGILFDPNANHDLGGGADIGLVSVRSWAEISPLIGRFADGAGKRTA